jgi:hypothetical protein
MWRKRLDFVPAGHHQESSCSRRHGGRLRTGPQTRGEAHGTKSACKNALDAFPPGSGQRQARNIGARNLPQAYRAVLSHRARRRLKEKKARQRQAQGGIQGKQSVIPLSRDPVIARNASHPLPAPRESAIHRTSVKPRKSERTMFKTALDLFQPFPAGVRASQVCPFCNNTRLSSPGTPCSYCQGAKE